MKIPDFYLSASVKSIKDVVSYNKSYVKQLKNLVEILNNLVAHHEELGWTLENIQELKE